MKYYLREFSKANIIGLTIFIVHSIILYVLGDPWYGDTVSTFFWQNQVFSVGLYAVNAMVTINFRKRYKGILWNFKILLYVIVAHIIITLITVFLLRLLLITGYYNVSLDQFMASEGTRDYVFPFIITAIATAAFYGVYHWKNKQESKVKQSKIIAGAASAKFDALKNQLDPHFLFNSLNVLASLIEENPKQAQKFTTSLSKVYRYVLEQKNKELVPLDEELSFARTYMNLLKMRFEDSIVVDIPEASSNPIYKVVPLSLQLLLENAVKHNQVTPSKKLFIKIYEEGNRLYIKNNIQKKQVIKKSSGVGLLNIRQRYNLLSNHDIRVEDTGGYFSVGVPMLMEPEQISFAPKQTAFLEDKRYQRAKKKVEDLKGFYIHFTIYCIMVPVFIYLNARSTSFPWAVFPILGWGWGVVGHASETFGWNPIFDKKWEKRKIQKLMEDEDF
ncbi:histidine kinase [Dokdonia sp. Hel_I_53]|uniref:histidine kinase n=1 Tax=Dokdonia sp. Hel_I_53 TaxID=1566287 RepID=UPI001198D6CD|nr:2TM domain-containing protein [Dokdonia sp. Hel_I_53]TVZ51583.1 LytS/YehU family sensor histidine kinase [Dokdonia sp. Hel_I_53]